MKKLIAILLVLVFAMGLFVGCSTGAGGDNADYSEMTIDELKPLIERVAPHINVAPAGDSTEEQYAFDCYIKHFGNNNDHVCEDISKAKANIPDHDLLVGGFPCQDYSIMKKNSPGIEGAKGVL